MAGSLSVIIPTSARFLCRRPGASRDELVPTISPLVFGPTRCIRGRRHIFPSIHMDMAAYIGIEVDLSSTVPTGTPYENLFPPGRGPPSS